MKILFAIQGTGNGHLSRARDVYPELCRYGTVDVLVSGSQVDVKAGFPIKYQFKGLSFLFGKHGGINMWGTARKLNLVQFLQDMKAINVSQYDLVINDFEPISAWSARRKKVPCISLSHQWAVMHQQAPKPIEPDAMGEFVLRHYAPCKIGYGFHFKTYGRRVFTPVIRKEIRALNLSNNGHITVYLPAYDDANLLPFLQYFKDTNWQVFSKHTTSESVQGNVSIYPIENDAFIKSMASSNGVMCGAGFEGPAEALFLGKKLLVVPMQDQYEQQCNAAALATLGVPVIKKISPKYFDRVHFWLSGAIKMATVDYADNLAGIIDELMLDFTRNSAKPQT